jgi:hypothetical protein
MWSHGTKYKYYKRKTFMQHTFAIIAMGLFVLFLIPGCVTPQAPPTENKTGNETICPTLDQPVCGIDNQTYSNSCLAQAAGVQIAYEEACKALEICTETDSGRDYFETGTTTKGKMKKDDRCADSTRLIEYYCTGSEIANETVGCQNGYECSIGKCVVVPTKPNCTDSDKGMDRYTAGVVSYAGDEYSDYCTIVDTVKEYYCANSTKTVSDTLLNCPLGFECQGGKCNEMPSLCSETDSGRDVKKKGSTKIMKGYATMDIQTDECHDNHVLREYFCTGNAIANELINCGSNSICSDDTCISLLCEDSDDGSDSLIAGFVSKGTERYNDTCINENSVKEYFCFSDNIENTIIKCPSGFVCSYGACTQTPGCSDSDSGKDYNTAGYVRKGSELFADSCVGGSLKEFFCTGDYVTSEIVSCAQGSSCFEGYCKSG